MKKLILIALFPLLGISQSWADTKCFIAKEGDAIIKQEGNCKDRHSPCSTFKIAISLMGYNEGILKDENSPKWTFYPESLPKRCRTGLTPKIWMERSCIRYSQHITLNFNADNYGKARTIFKSYVEKFNYGNKDISGDKGEYNGLTHAWLTSSLKISPEEQIIFLEKLNNYQLPVSKDAINHTRNILYLEDLPGGWKLFGKTGSGNQQNGDDTENKDLKIGWFVGWIEKENRKIIFAHYIEDGKKTEESGGKLAKQAAKEKLLELIKS